MRRTVFFTCACSLCSVAPVYGQAFPTTRFCEQSAGITGGAKIAACIDSLPAVPQGGIADSQGMQGTQVMATDIFASITKPVTWRIGGTMYQFQADTTIPPNVLIEAGAGVTISVNAGKTLTINGRIDGYDNITFSRAGTVVFDKSLNLPVINNMRYCNQFAGANVGARIASCVADLPSMGGVADARGLEGAQSITATISSRNESIHLILGAGTLTFSGTQSIFALGNNSIIEGQGQGVTVLRVSANTSDGINPGANMIIRNLTLQGNLVSSPGHSGIDGCNCTNVTIDNVEVLNWGDHGINTGNISTNWKILNSNIHDNYNDGILMASGTTGHLVQNNHVYNNGGNGIDNGGASQTRILANLVNNNGAKQFSIGLDCEGVVVTSIDGTANNVEVSNNTVYDNYCKGVNVRADSYGTTYNVRICPQ